MSECSVWVCRQENQLFCQILLNITWTINLESIMCNGGYKQEFTILFNIILDSFRCGNNYALCSVAMATIFYSRLTFQHYLARRPQRT